MNGPKNNNDICLCVGGSRWRHPYSLRRAYIFISVYKNNLTNTLMIDQIKMLLITVHKQTFYFIELIVFFLIGTLELLDSCLVLPCGSALCFHSALLKTFCLHQFSLFVSK